MSLASTNMSIRHDWRIGVSEFSTDSKVIQYFMKIKLNKKEEYWNNWNIRVPSKKQSKYKAKLTGVLEYQSV